MQFDGGLPRGEAEQQAAECLQATAFLNELKEILTHQYFGYYGLEVVIDTTSTGKIGRASCRERV